MVLDIEKETCVELLKQCRSGDEWNKICDDIKKLNNKTYPEWWYSEIIESGVAHAMSLYFTYGDAFKPVWIEDRVKGIELDEIAYNTNILSLKAAELATNLEGTQPELLLITLPFSS